MCLSSLCGKHFLLPPQRFFTWGSNSRDKAIFCRGIQAYVSEWRLQIHHLIEENVLLETWNKKSFFADEDSP